MTTDEIMALHDEARGEVDLSWDSPKRAALRAAVEQLVAERDQALARLPEGMKDCTILFKECEIGHGTLTATNWIQHDCLVCRAEKAERDALRYRWLRSSDNADKVAVNWNIGHDWIGVHFGQLDAAIEAALGDKHE